MYPGLTEADCRVAEFRFREMQTESQLRRCGAHPGTGATRQRLGALMVWAGRLLAGRALHLPAGGAVAAADASGPAR